MDPATMYDVDVYADPSTLSPELLHGVRSDDAESWRRLVHIYGPLVYRWCRESKLQASDAADVTQEVFFALLQGIGRFRREHEGDTFRGWLRTITRNKIRDLVRRRERIPQTVGDRPCADSQMIQDADAGGWQQEAVGLISRVLAIIEQDFDPRTWQAFLDTTLHELSAAEVAARLGMTPKAVRQAKYRVLVRLRDELEPRITPA
jgi:RNA polymerase sigma-70 factor (ECF subfamily)